MPKDIVDIIEDSLLGEIHKILKEYKIEKLLADVTKTVHCENCDKYFRPCVYKDLNFCGFCGSKLEKENVNIIYAYSEEPQEKMTAPFGISFSTSSKHKYDVILCCNKKELEKIQSNNELIKFLQKDEDIAQEEALHVIFSVLNYSVDDEPFKNKDLNDFSNVLAHATHFLQTKDSLQSIHNYILSLITSEPNFDKNFRKIIDSGKEYMSILLSFYDLFKIYNTKYNKNKEFSYKCTMNCAFGRFKIYKEFLKLINTLENELKSILLHLKNGKTKEAVTIYKDLYKRLGGKDIIKKLSNLQP